MNAYRKNLINKAKKEKCLYDAIHHSKNSDIQLAIWDAWSKYWGEVRMVEDKQKEEVYQARKLKMQQDAKRRREESKESSHKREEGKK